MLSFKMLSLYFYINITTVAVMAVGMHFITSVTHSIKYTLKINISVKFKHIYTTTNWLDPMMSQHSERSIYLPFSECSISSIDRLQKPWVDCENICVVHNNHVPSYATLFRRSNTPTSFGYRIRRSPNYY